MSCRLRSGRSRRPAWCNIVRPRVPSAPHPRPTLEPLIPPRGPRSWRARRIRLRRHRFSHSRGGPRVDVFCKTRRGPLTQAGEPGWGKLGLERVLGGPRVLRRRTGPAPRRRAAAAANEDLVLSPQHLNPVDPLLAVPETLPWPSLWALARASPLPPARTGRLWPPGRRCWRLAAAPRLRATCRRSEATPQCRGGCQQFDVQATIKSTITRV